MRTVAWRVKWVEDMPPVLEPGTFYVSEKHRLTEHLCACGCRTEVSLPLGPSEWRIEREGELVTLRPSVGNWKLPCRSHYIIDKNTTRWCESWSEQQIMAGRARAREATEREIANRRRQKRWWLRLWYWLCRWLRG